MTSPRGFSRRGLAVLEGFCKRERYAPRWIRYAKERLEKTGAGAAKDRSSGSKQEQE